MQPRNEPRRRSGPLPAGPLCHRWDSLFWLRLNVALAISRWEMFDGDVRDAGVWVAARTPPFTALSAAVRGLRQFGAGNG